MTAQKFLFYIALLLTAGVSSAQETSDAPSDVPSMSPGGMMSFTPTMVPDTATGTTALPTATNSSMCEVCGPGRTVGDPEKEIVFEDVSRTCSEIEDIGLAGYFNISVCEQVVGVFEVQDPCDCMDVESGPSPSPTAQITSSATVWSSAALLASLLAATTASMAFIV